MNKIKKPIMPSNTTVSKGNKNPKMRPTNYQQVNKKFIRSSLKMSILNWIKNKFKRKTLSDVFNSRLESHQDVKTQGHDPSKQLEDDKLLEDVTPSVQQLYSISLDKKSKVYHILRQVDRDEIPFLYISICNLLNTVQSSNIIPSDRRLCKLCESLIDK